METDFTEECQTRITKQEKQMWKEDGYCSYCGFPESYCKCGE